jgi:SanA protein
MPPSRSHRLRRIARIAGASIALLALAAAGISAHVARIGSTCLRDSLADLRSAPVAIVLGAGMRADGTPSDALADRLAQAVELYRAGKVPKLLLSGDHGVDDYDEVNGMRRWVLERGVAPADVFCDHHGFSTWQTFARARDVFGVERAIVVTQRFHMPRALFTARANAIEAEGVPCDARTYVNAARYELREFGSRCKAWLQSLGIASDVRAGPPIPIAGDGRASWDRFD